VVTLDADGQHDPNEIPKLIHPILKGKADIVVGSRYVKGAFTDAPLYRKIGLRVINYFSRKMHKLPIGDTQSGFRAYSKRALSVVRLCESKGYGVELEQLALIDKEGGKLKIVEVPISVRYKGLEKTSKKHPLRHASELVTVILGLVVERRPLLFLGVPGALLTVLGIVLATYLLWLFNSMRYFSIPIAIVSLGALIVGLLLTITALTLHALTRLRSKFR
jgi:glycosyltransferase involved in cell wall biosynthesis